MQVREIIFDKRFPEPMYFLHFLLGPEEHDEHSPSINGGQLTLMLECERWEGRFETSAEIIYD